MIFLRKHLRREYWRGYQDGRNAERAAQRDWIESGPTDERGEYTNPNWSEYWAKRNAIANACIAASKDNPHAA